MSISRYTRFLFLIVLLLGPPVVLADQPTTLYFSNLLWHVKEGRGGPGPNNWSRNNVWVDASGRLHLKISKINGVWYCPEVYTDKRLGFGEYTFYTIGRIDTLDRNLVLGLFHYTTPDIGPDTTNEIDIEFARWGDPNHPIGNYTVWPAVTGIRPTTHVFNVSLDGTYTTHGYHWSSQSISFKSGYGHYPNFPYLIHAWRYAPSDYTRRIPQHAMPMHLNFWLLRGMPPINGQEAEIIISKFCYKPVVGVGNC